MRKKWVIPALLLSVLMISGAARAEERATAFVGAGVQFADGGGVFITYQAKRFEYQLSLWNGNSNNIALGVGYPLRIGRKVQFGWVPGIAAVGRRTEVLGTYWQFHNRFELTYAPSFNLQAHLAWVHYSNCSQLCDHTETPNLGENFVTLGLRYGLKPKRVTSGDGLPPPTLRTAQTEDG
jgi:hypothetical protein